MREKHKEKLAALRSKINFQRIHEMKYLNQDIVRKNLALAQKDNKIRELRAKYSKKALAQELAETKQLKNVNRNKKRSKKAKTSNTGTPSCECVLNNAVQIENLQEEVRMKNETIGDLQNEHLCLEETIDSLKCGREQLAERGGRHILQT